MFDWGTSIFRKNPDDKRSIQLKDLGVFNFVYVGDATYDGLLKKFCCLNPSDWEYKINEEGRGNLGEFGYNEFKLREDSNFEIGRLKAS